MRDLIATSCPLPPFRTTTLITTPSSRTTLHIQTVTKLDPGAQFVCVIVANSTMVNVDIVAQRPGHVLEHREILDAKFKQKNYSGNK